MRRVKFQVDTKKGQTVYKVSVGIRSNGCMHKSVSFDPHGIQIKELKIVHQTPYKIALSDPFVTLLDRMHEGKRKESYQTCLEYVVVSVKTKESFFPNGVFATIYTVGKPEKAINKLRSTIKKKLDEEYSFLYDIDIDSVIDGFIETQKP